MTVLDLQYAFELETNSIDDTLVSKLKSEDILYWLNSAVNKFIKTRFDGNNATHKSFEQNEKRSRDLISLLSSKTYEPTDISYSRKGFDVYTIDYPENFMFMLDESVELYKKGDSQFNYWQGEIFECTLDNYMYRITNKLTDFHLRNNYARPIRVRTKSGCNLFTDGNYSIKDYVISYIRNPEKITLNDPFKEYTDLPDFALQEVVKLAVQMYVASLHDPRYETISAENSTME